MLVLPTASATTLKPTTKPVMIATPMTIAALGDRLADLAERAADYAKEGQLPLDVLAAAAGDLQTVQAIMTAVVEKLAGSTPVIRQPRFDRKQR